MLKVALIYSVTVNERGKYELQCVQKKGVYEKLSKYPAEFESREQALGALAVFMKRA